MQGAREIFSPAEIDASRQTTLAAFSQIDHSTLLQLSQLTLPEIEAIQQEVAQVFPAGNLPALVLSGLVKLKGRVIDSGQVRQDVTALMQGISLIGKGLYGFFIGPAAALYAYQKILQLAGKDIASAFPQGTWQFYLQFGLREDTARHANETIGFQQALPQAGPTKMAAAWLCAALELLYRYDALLAADWAERVMLRVLIEEATHANRADQAPFITLVEDWNKQRPYHRPPDGTDYAAHREATFQQFVQERIRALPNDAQTRFNRRYKSRVEEELAAYQEQMTILAALKPERYQDEKEPIALWEAALGFVWQGWTYLLPACQQDEHGSPLCFPVSDSPQPVPLYALPDGDLCDAARQRVKVDRSGRVWYKTSGRLLGRLRPPSPEMVLGWLGYVFARPYTDAPVQIVTAPRALQAQLRDQLPAATQAELTALRHAPIILNWDAAAARLPLAYIRQGARGVGDHALTLFRTDQSMVFDQSHIFFDGMWGLAVAEMLTDGAIFWYRSIESRSPVPPTFAPAPLTLTGLADMATQSHAQPEAAAESDGVDMERLLKLRQWLRQRGVRLTINDLLLLYRFFHAAWYQPSLAVRQALEQAYTSYPNVQAACEAVSAALSDARQTNPALLIPMDASNVSPRERIFPTTFRNPLTELQAKFTTAQKYYLDVRAHPGQEHWTSFDYARRELLAYLHAFGSVLDAWKAVTMRGENFNTATIRLLAHLPASMQYLLDQIPQHIGVLNEIIKGAEVFSNVGRVAPGSSLTRFISAKDDGQTKELVWGIITDDQNRMHISLRDFRPFVPLLLAAGQKPLADMLAQDYLDSYVNGLNRFVVELAALISYKAPEG